MAADRRSSWPKGPPKDDMILLFSLGFSFYSLTLNVIEHFVGKSLPGTSYETPKGLKSLINQ